MKPPQREEIMRGVYLTCQETEKFKTSCLSLYFARPLEASDASKNALLPPLLLRGTESRPNIAEISKTLNELYGAELASACIKRDENQLAGFSGGVIDGRFADSEPLLEKYTELIGEALLHPVLKDGNFLAEYFAGEKRNLTDAVDGMKNDKRRYALRRLIEEMCAGEPYSVDRLGNREGLKSITASGIISHYKSILETSPIYLYFCGNTSFETVRETFIRALDTLPRGEIIKPAKVTAGNAKGLKTVFESMDVAQGKLALGFRLAKNYGWAASAVFGSMFGSGMTSKLFRKVREEMSLCYHISSTVAVNKQLLLVSAGIEVSDFEKARDEIFFQLDECKRGNISEAELSNAKASILSSVKSVADSHSRLEDFYSSQFFNDELYTIGERIEQVRKVTLEDLIDLASGCVPDTIYFLRGNNE